MIGRCRHLGHRHRRPVPAASIVRSAKIATIKALDAERPDCLPISDRAAVSGEVLRLFDEICHRGESQIRGTSQAPLRGAPT